MLFTIKTASLSLYGIIKNFLEISAWLVFNFNVASGIDFKFLGSDLAIKWVTLNEPIDKLILNEVYTFI